MTTNATAYCNNSDLCNQSNPTYHYPQSSIKTYNGNLFGAGIQVGYKQFFGQSKHFGLRYYGMFSGQGGSYSALYGSGSNADFPVQINQPSANLFYGVGIDALFNFYERNNRTFGLFAGVMIGGSSWLMGGDTAENGGCRWQNSSQGSAVGPCFIMNNFWKQQANTASEPNSGGEVTFSPTFVQFIVNVGLRTNLTKHQGFEFGVRIPTINDPYFTAKNTASGLNGLLKNYGNPGGSDSKYTITFRRNVALYWNYVINF
ncbi:outer membrane protein [Helicobacter felis]|uniref:outer membrane protein n=1 Tax=Helicobacter felis TaxID=214 RepID=UPI000CEDCB1D|nr:outer membrane protein [Helicobacter felis]